MRRLLLLAALALGATSCGGTTTVTVTRTVAQTKTVTVTKTVTAPAAAALPCSAGDLTGTFAVVPGSAAAGSISYQLRLTNESGARCSVSGIPAVQLLDRLGAKLPTAVSPVPGASAAVRVELEPGDSATADLRFSPDVPGVGEPTGATCEPKAYTLRVTFVGGTLDAPVVPPTPVCEHGSLFASNLTAAH